jgi:hypothetical protein
MRLSGSKLASKPRGGISERKAANVIGLLSFLLASVYGRYMPRSCVASDVGAVGCHMQSW